VLCSQSSWNLCTGGPSIGVLKLFTIILSLPYVVNYFKNELLLNNYSRTGLFKIFPQKEVVKFCKRKNHGKKQGNQPALCVCFLVLPNSQTFSSHWMCVYFLISLILAAAPVMYVYAPHTCPNNLHLNHAHRFGQQQQTPLPIYVSYHDISLLLCKFDYL
jgi:hypothetical protein